MAKCCKMGVDKDGIVHRDDFRKKLVKTTFFMSGIGIVKYEELQKIWPVA